MRYAPLWLALACSGRSAPDTQEPVETGLPEVAPIPTALVSDGANERIVWIRLDTAQVIYEIDLNEYRPSLCEGETLECVVYAVDHALDEATGEDLILFVYSRVRVVGDAVESLGSVIEQLRLTAGGPELDWSIDSLDFTERFPDAPDLCEQATPCVAPEDEGEVNWRNCALSGVHDVELETGDGGELTIWVADTARRSRVLQIAPLSPTDTCAVVEEALAPATIGDWDPLEHTNDLDRVEIDGEPMVLATHKGSNPIFGGGVGQGRATLWADRGGWSQVTEHPADGFLNAPHNSDLRGVDDERYLIYAHSNGRGVNSEDDGFALEQDNAGSVGVARLDGQSFTYLYDGYLDGGAPLGFIRDADLIDAREEVGLPGGTALVTDSGCNDDVYAKCPKAPGLRHLSLPLDAQPTGATGAWRDDYSQQVFVQVDELDSLFASPLDCDFSIPYEADLIWSDATGGLIRERLADGVVVRECSAD